ncbi:hypothetical protein PACTADRAFT_49127 [Pachysolen tannophilus NRRL Y-2460]|uniref:Phosphoribulokinase/uridine kinase domain-containing protein n=1 Tax=Pachysolen tannophilus NRRL Y-2460 TaxID=669874 RepID=A0A1E4U089_PACTA|nr:hypothetical protein PACTADRAFT_49127 [Pachysolen tannophilus NRRL Y-2460]
MTRDQVVLIGLSGASSSGKTTVSKYLHKLIGENSILVHQDDFYLPNEQIPWNESHTEQNWDCAGAIDFPKFIETLDKMKTDFNYKYHVDSLELDVDDADFKLSSEEFSRLKASVEKKLKECFLNKGNFFKIYLIDGFLLYHNRQVLDRFDIRLFYKASYSNLKKRRNARAGYNTVGGFYKDPPNYFDDFVWPEYYQNHRFLFAPNQNEFEIKVNSGDLNEYALEYLKLKPFNNDDDSHGSLEKLLQETIDYIFDNI